MGKIMQRDLNKNMGQATKWSTLAEIATKLIAPVTNAFLARLLVPEVFGVVATLTMVVSFAEIFTDAGFQKYLVQNQFSTDENLDNGTNVAFWTNLIFSFILWGGIALFATSITNLVGSPGCEAAVIAMCAQIPVQAFSSIQMARYRRDFDFKNLFFARIATAIVPLVVTVPLAFVLKSYWALVLGTLSRDVLNAVILTAKSKWKPRFYYSFKKLKEMLSFSMWTVVENVTIWLTNYSGTFIVSTVLSAYYLGLYKTTITTVNAYMSLITAATTPVLFSALSRCQDDDQAFREVFFRFQRMVALIVFPLGFGVFIYRDLITSILLGKQWAETANFLGLWSLTSSLTIIFSNYNSEVYRSKGRPKLSVLVQSLHLVVMIPVLLFFANAGYSTLTIARAVVRLEMIVVSLITMQIAIGIRFTDVMKNIWPSLVSAVFMLVAGMILRTISTHIVFEFTGIAICALVYGISMYVIPKGREQLAEIPIVKKVMNNVSKH